MSTQVFTDDFKSTPYWWEDAPLDDTPADPLPDEVDVLVVGSGYTGLHAALQTARAGMRTLVLDSEQLGFGCSSRNGGQISTSIKYNYAQLIKRFNEPMARDILAMGQASLDYVGEFVRDEKIDCGFDVAGRFHGAHSARAYAQMAREVDQPNPVFNSGAYMVSKEQQHVELGTDQYHGGMVFPKYASVHPARYHAGILQRVKTAGAALIGNCAVESITPAANANSKHRFLVQCARGTVATNNVVIATNGYTGPLTPWQQRRVIPIGSYIIATEEIDNEQMRHLFPTKRMLTDSRKLVYYYRPSPDHKRIIFGGRVSLAETNTRKSGPKLRTELCRLFPSLSDVRVSHSWTGTVAYTFDSLMHCGEQDGLHYAMGYCGSGVGMASFLGKCIGQQIADLGATDIPLAKTTFQTRPLYRGTPWFLAPSVWLYRMRDKVNL